MQESALLDEGQIQTPKQANSVQADMHSCC